MSLLRFSTFSIVSSIFVIANCIFITVALKSLSGTSNISVFLVLASTNFSKFSLRCFWLLIR